MIGSLDRGQKPTRMQQQEDEENKRKQQQMMNQTQVNHKRGQSTAPGASNRIDQPMSSIHQANPMAALNINNIKDAVQSEISAQKKYKLELQAEINKLRTKYQDYSKIENRNIQRQQLRDLNPQQDIIGSNNQKMVSKKESQNTKLMQDEKLGEIRGTKGIGTQPSISSNHKERELVQHQISGLQNRPQLQTISYGGSKDQNETQSSIVNHRGNYNTSVNSKNAVGDRGNSMNSRQVPTDNSVNNSIIDYNRSIEKSSAMGMTQQGFNKGQHMRYQSQLTHQAKQEMQNRMNMTITHGFNTNQSSIVPSSYTKDQSMKNHTQQYGTAGQAMRPNKGLQQSNNQALATGTSIYSSVNNQNMQNAWKAIEMNTTKGHSSQGHSHQRNISSRFATNPVPNTQLSSIVHTSGIKTNNLVMDSMSNHKADKKVNLNTTIQPLSSNLGYNSVIQSKYNDNSPQG